MVGRPRHKWNRSCNGDRPVVWRGVIPVELEVAEIVAVVETVLHIWICAKVATVDVRS